MSLKPLSDSDSLAALAARLATAPFIALDTEFLRERTYRAQLCLLQLASPTEALCVDPLAGVALDALLPVLSGNSTPKILHAARQDLEVLWPLFGAVAPVFDTQIAAALAGMPAQIGYSELVRRILGVDLAKAETRTDWSKRPLSDAQLRYAIDDVTHLGALRDSLTTQLHKLGRLAWLDEELHELARVDRLFVDPEKAVERLRWSNELDPDRSRLAQRLAAWRERRAADKDRPRSWILDDAALRALVLRVPRTADQLAGIEEITEGFRERSGAMILEVIAGTQLPAQLPPLEQRVRPDAEFQARVKNLAGVVQRKAAELKLAPELLSTRRELESIARGEPTAEVLHGWRREVIGSELLAAV
ncbi:MAG: ribonuclease D [Steroidobacteraceae bacterium]